MYTYSSGNRTFTGTVNVVSSRRTTTTSLDVSGIFVSLFPGHKHSSYIESSMSCSVRLAAVTAAVYGGRDTVIE